jgi:hypothetical protein
MIHLQSLIFSAGLAVVAEVGAFSSGIDESVILVSL